MTAHTGSARDVTDSGSTRAVKLKMESGATRPKRSRTEPTPAELAREVARALLMPIGSTGDPIPGAHAALARLGAHGGYIDVRLETREVTCDHGPLAISISEVEESRRLRRGGLRRVILASATPLDHFKRFVDTLRNGGADLPGALMAHEFDGIEYITTEDMQTTLPGLNERDGHAGLSGYLQAIFAPPDMAPLVDPSDVSREMLSLSALESAAPKVQPLIVPRPYTSEDERQAVDVLAGEAANDSLLRKAVNLLVAQSLQANGGVEARRLEDALMSMFDAALMTVNTRLLGRLVRTLAELSGGKVADVPVQRQREMVARLRGMLGEVDRLEHVVSVAVQLSEQHQQLARALVLSVGSAAISRLSESAADCRDPDTREFLNSLLERLVRPALAAAEEVLPRVKQGAARTLAALILAICGGEAVPIIERSLAASGSANKRAILETIERNVVKQITPDTLELCLTDPSRAVRLKTAAIVSNELGQGAAPLLLKIVKSVRFQSRKDDERRALYIALGQTGDSRALNHLGDLVGDDGSYRAVEPAVKEMALGGLEAAGTEAAADLLADIASGIGRKRGFRRNIERAVSRLNDQLFRRDFGR